MTAPHHQERPWGNYAVLGVGDSVDVPVGGSHRIGNTGAEPMEDDIERLKDDYGRT